MDIVMDIVNGHFDAQTIDILLYIPVKRLQTWWEHNWDTLKLEEGEEERNIPVWRWVFLPIMPFPVGKSQAKEKSCLQNLHVHNKCKPWCYKARQYSTVQYSTVQYSMTVRYSAVGKLQLLLIPHASFSMMVQHALDSKLLFTSPSLITASIELWIKTSKMSFWWSWGMMALISSCSLYSEHVSIISKIIQEILVKKF